MLSFSIRQQLKALLLQIAKQEKQLEVLRQILCEQYNFEPYSAFQRLDADRKGFLLPIDVCEFLTENEIPVTSPDAALYIRHYAEENPQSLLYPEFLASVLPLDNPELRTVATQRKVYPVNEGEVLSYEVEYALSRVLSQEIIYYHHLDPIKGDLVSQYGFSFKAAFTTIDKHETGFIDYDSLKEFFRVNGSTPSEEDLIAIIRRIDKDGDGKVSYKELVEAIQPINPETSASKSLRESGEIKIQDQGSPTRTSPLKTSGQKQIFGETNRSQGLQRSPIQTFSARSGSQKDKTSPLRSEIRSPQQGSDKKSIRSTMKKSFIGELRREGTLRDRDSDRLEGLLRVLKEIVVLEREVETAKEDLALRSDFNLFDAFRIFDRKGTGTVSAGQIEQGLNELGIFPSKDQLFLFVRKFDKDADAILKFSDMCDGFIPMQSEYVKLLKSRTANNGDLFFDFKQILSAQTLRLLKGLLLLHLENESIIEAMRQKLARDPKFDTHKIFDVLDKDQDGFISIFELRNLMEQYHMYITDKDLTFLINRFDKDGKEKISYIEFIQEITPKSPERRF